MKFLNVFWIFCTIGLFAQDSSLKRYNELLANYQQGKKDYVELPYLAYTALDLQQKDLANKIAQDYTDNYLLKMKGEIFYSVGNINFIGQFNQSSKEKIFKLFYENADKIDKSIGIPGYSRGHIDFIIAKEDIDPQLWKDSNPQKPIRDHPNWAVMCTKISEKYNEDYAHRTIINAKLRWYQYKKDTLELAKAYIEKFDRYGLDTVGFGKYVVNNALYNFVFKHSQDTTELLKAAGWMEALVRSDPHQAGFIDTYANLLYKLGKNEEALQWEEKAISMAPNDIEIRTAWNKMKIGKPTWVVSNEFKKIN